MNWTNTKHKNPQKTPKDTDRSIRAENVDAVSQTPNSDTVNKDHSNEVIAILILKLVLINNEYWFMFIKLMALTLLMLNSMFILNIC